MFDLPFQFYFLFESDTPPYSNAQTWLSRCPSPAATSPVPSVDCSDSVFEEVFGAFDNTSCQSPCTEGGKTVNMDLS